jgi:lipopolysaccharide export system permease protein
LKILDRYILKNFIQNFFFGIFCFIIIFILIDLFENLDKFFDRQVPPGIIFNYYLNFVPEIIKLLIPVATLLASLFTISRFNTYSEFTAMQSGGMSLARYLAPIIGFGLILTIFSLYFNGWIVPQSNKGKFAIERAYLGKNQIRTQIQNLYLQDNFNRIVTIGLYNEVENKAENVSIQVFNVDTLTNLKYRLDVSEMKWDSINYDWKGKVIILRKFINDSTIALEELQDKNISEFPEIGKISLTPGIITKNQLKPDELSRFVKISQVFGYNGDMNPVLTAWFANIIFLAIALVNFLRMKI